MIRVLGTGSETSSCLYDNKNDEAPVHSRSFTSLSLCQIICPKDVKKKKLNYKLI